MKRVVLPHPPNPDDLPFRQDSKKYNLAVYRWMSDVKGKIEQASSVNDVPMNQALVVGSFTLTTAIAGTSTGADVTNFVCTLVQGMTQKGWVAPTQNANEPQ